MPGHPCVDLDPMNDRTLRTVVTGLTGLLVLVIAVTLLIIVGRSGSGTASPSAPPIAIASPSAGATTTPARERVGDAEHGPRTEPTATPESSPSAGRIGLTAARRRSRP